MFYNLAKEYLSTCPAPSPNPEGGRPKTSDDALILTIASIQNLNQYSFREALECCEDYFDNIPALSTYHELLAQFTSDIAQGFVEHTGKKVISLSKDKTLKAKTSKKKGATFRC
ncbi:hypothetical protein FJ208_00775 [Candidatus Gribaldobacteria bacterium]|nr:hypothetical protein [Candidatus Gribaldobacteria bacterium]